MKPFNFDINEVYRLQQKQKRDKLEVIKYHFNQAYKKMIKSYNSYEDHILYQIPYTTFKLPPYNSEEITEKLSICFRKKGYEVKKVNLNLLRIEFEKKPSSDEYLNYIMEDIVEKIMEAVEDKCSEIMYEIPRIMYNKTIPNYDSLYTKRKIKEILKKNGFLIRSYRDNLILNIEWGHYKRAKDRVDRRLQSQKQQEQEQNSQKDLENEKDSESFDKRALTLKRMQQFIQPKVVQNVRISKSEDLNEKYNNKLKEYCVNNTKKK